MAVRFGVFVPQGWRIDLVEIRRSGRAVRGDDRRRQGGRCRAGLGLDLGLRPLPHRARAGAGDDLRVLDDHRHPGARHQPGQHRADGRLQRLSQPRPLRQDRLHGRRRQPRPALRRDRRRLVRARVARLWLRLPRDAGADAHVPRGGPDHPQDVDRGLPDVPGQALHASTARSTSRRACRSRTRRSGSAAAASR